MKMKRKLSALPLYFVDVETTGLDHSKDQVIEFCIIKQTKYRITSIHRKVTPEVPIDPQAQKVNGYSVDKWRDAISQEEAAKQISDFVEEKGVWCGHNISFDTDFVSNLLLRYGYRCIPRRQVDTYALAYEHLVPMGLRSLSMDEIRAFMGWNISFHHDAQTDAFDTRRLYNYIKRMGMRKKCLILLRSLPYRWKQ